MKQAEFVVKTMATADQMSDTVRMYIYLIKFVVKKKLVKEFMKYLDEQEDEEDWNGKNNS